MIPQGFYETALENLNCGARYVHFHPDRAAFDELRDKLSCDARLKSDVVCLDEGNDKCQLLCVSPVPELFQMLNFAIWNPGLHNMEGYSNMGDPIKLERQGDRLVLKSRVLMRPIGRVQLDRLYERIVKPVYEDYVRKMGFTPRVVVPFSRRN